MTILPARWLIRRRSALALLAAGAVLLAWPGRLFDGRTLKLFVPTPQGYGTDPDLLSPKSPWPKKLTVAQRRTVASLADVILPASDRARAPSSMGVDHFLDDWVSAPYPDQAAEGALLVSGIDWLDQQAAQHGGKSFAELSEPDKVALVEAMADGTLSDGQDFFYRVRRLAVGAYYATKEGMDELGYVGNVALESFPQITDEEQAILDTALKTLGL